MPMQLTLLDVLPMQLTLLDVIPSTPSTVNVVYVDSSSALLDAQICNLSWACTRLDK